MEEYDFAILDRQSRSRGAAGLSERSDHRPDRFDAGGIVHDAQPFFEFARHVPGRGFDVSKTGPVHAGVQLRRGQHADMRRIAQPFDRIVQF